MLRGHGGEIYDLARKFGLRPEEIRDHSSNVSPLPPPQGLYDWLAAHLREIEALPEVDNETLRQALSQKLGLPSSQILPSSGTTEWIFALPRLLRPKRTLIIGPTYADYADASLEAGAEVDYFLAQPEESFVPSLTDITQKIPGHELVFWCNPNNPTGVYFKREKILEIVYSYEESIFVVDESYLDFVTDLAGSLVTIRPFPKNLVVLRSFSKIYRIPGLRLGYAVASPPLAERLWQAYLPWSINRLAQVAGPWLLNQSSYLERTRQLVHQERQRLIARLASLPGVKCFPGKTPFFLLCLAYPTDKLWEILLRRYHLLVRQAGNFVGLDNRYLRVALRSPKENDFLLKAFEELLA